VIQLLHIFCRPNKKGTFIVAVLEHGFLYVSLSQLTEKIYKNLDYMTRLARFTVPFPLFAYPIYLVSAFFYQELRQQCVVIILNTQFKVMSFVCDVNSFQFGRSPGKEGSHFNPYSNLFPPNERKGIAISTLCWLIMFSLLIYLSFIISPLQVIKVYGIPYWVNHHSFTVNASYFFQLCNWKFEIVTTSSPLTI